MRTPIPRRVAGTVYDSELIPNCRRGHREDLRHAVESHRAASHDTVFSTAALKHVEKQAVKDLKHAEPSRLAKVNEANQAKISLAKDMLHDAETGAGFGFKPFAIQRDYAALLRFIRDQIEQAGLQHLHPDFPYLLDEIEALEAGLPPEWKLPPVVDYDEPDITTDAADVAEAEAASTAAKAAKPEPIGSLPPPRRETVKDKLRRLFAERGKLTYRQMQELGVKNPRVPIRQMWRELDTDGLDRNASFWLKEPQQDIVTTDKTTQQIRRIHLGD